METQTERFDPNQYLTTVSGRPYLEVKWRIAWFRSDHPDGTIEVDLLSHDLMKGVAVVKATVTTKTGGFSSDIGSEEASDFGDYVEKATTKAIGRALGSLGYGTQFTDDHAFGASVGRVVDSPVARPSENRGGAYENRPPAQVITGPDGQRMATDKQIKFIGDLAREVGYEDVDTQGMTFNDASALITQLQAERGSR